jgi:hypothetical protein
MYQLFTDKNKVFECNIALQGASLKDSICRVILQLEDMSYMYSGTITQNGKCTIPIKKLHNLTDGVKGKLTLEVIADDTYFQPWNSEVEVVTSKKITVEVKDTTDTKSIVVNESKPKMTAVVIEEPIKEVVKETTTVPISKKNPILNKKKVVKEVVKILSSNQLIKEFKTKTQLVAGINEILNKFKLNSLPINEKKWIVTNSVKILALKQKNK